MWSAAGGDDTDALIHFVNGFVNVAEGALLEALSEGIVFFAGDVLMRFFEQLLGAVQSTGVVETSVNRRMVVTVLAIIDCRS